MNLPMLPKKEPRPTAVTVRLSKGCVANLKMLADAHNLSQADIIEHLINQTATEFSKQVELAKARKKKD